MNRKISYSDCLLNAAVQLTVRSEGRISLAELQARAAHADAWLHLGDAIGKRGWVDVDDLTAFVEE